MTEDVVKDLFRLDATFAQLLSADDMCVGFTDKVNGYAVNGYAVGCPVNASLFDNPLLLYDQKNYKYLYKPPKALLFLC